MPRARAWLRSLRAGFSLPRPWRAMLSLEEDSRRRLRRRVGRTDRPGRVRRRAGRWEGGRRCHWGRSSLLLLLSLVGRSLSSESGQTHSYFSLLVS